MTINNENDELYKNALSDLKIGDIVLVEGCNKISPKLIAAQKLFYLKACSSHVMIHIGDGIVIHATGGKGVHLSPLFLELENCKTNWRVIRNNKLAEMNLDLVLKNTLQFYAQSYSTEVYKSKDVKFVESESSFCSELAHKIYLSLGIDIQLTTIRKLFPCDLDRLADDICPESDWIIVTDSYKEIFNLPDLDDYKFSLEMHTLHMDLRLKKRLHLSKSREFTFGTALAEAQKNRLTKSLEALDLIKGGLKNRQLNFWFDKDAQFGERPIPSMAESVSGVEDLLRLEFEGMQRMIEIIAKYKK